ncbi:TPA: hypothetical protein I7D81_002184 [Vibrio cholerae]|nr:hypothetical protein [Vibrio cholerae]HAS5229101.1 hypothetical protein [Vibrio cholerae]HAS5236826.1 hypothetical protein [Vibrio cholerae]HAS5240532.1 hypothetical protein [Vibrio cholerae]HAS5297807.1 hypothetical protein [Vibrio cholerae]
MKISDFFSNLPWRTDGNVSFLYLTPEQNRAIAIAVNNHDRLTEENKKLREALEKSLRVVNRAAAMDDSEAKSVRKEVRKLLLELGGER